MIGFLKGILMDVYDGQAIVEVSGVGYQVFLPQHLNQGVGNAVELFIYTHVREDALMLFGFSTKLEKKVFQQLLKVSGIGAKTALQIVSQFSADVLISIISTKDSKTLCSVKGIGKKAAEKIILELSGTIHKIAGMSELDAKMSVSNVAPAHAHELISALTNLGYKRFDIDRVVNQIDFDRHANFDQQFKESLKHLST